MPQYSHIVKAKDGQQINFVFWKAKGVAVGTVCLIHGFGEHVGRYDHFFSHFSNNGYNVCSMDLRGHGNTPSKRGCIPSYDALLDDIEMMIETAAKMAAGLPIFLYGHSMGGNLAINYILDRKTDMLSGAVLSAPWLMLKKQPGRLLVSTVKSLSRFMPDFIIDSGLKINDLTSNPVVIDKTQSDKKYHRNMSLRLFTQINSHAEDAIKKAQQIHLPMLLMQGTDDRVVSSEKNIEFAKNAADMCELHVFDGFFHELHNECRGEMALITAVEWMNKITSKK